MKKPLHRICVLTSSLLVCGALASAAVGVDPVGFAGQDDKKTAQDPPKPKAVPKPKAIPKPKQDPKPQGGGITKQDPRNPQKGELVKDPRTGDLVPAEKLKGLDPRTGKPLNGKAAPAASVEKDQKAKLSIDFGKEKHDFGSTRQGDILEHTFELVSEGENPVKIRQASPTCGCTVTGVKIEGDGGEPIDYKLGDPIPAGKKVFITGVLDTGSKKNKTQVRINVYTNDAIGLTQLALAADIEPFLVVTPPFVNFGDIKRGETKTQTIDIRTSRSEPIGLELDSSNPIKIPDGLSVDLKPVNPNEDGRAAQWRATISVGEGAKDGNLGYQLRLRSDVPLPGAAEKIADQTPGAHKHAHNTHYTANASVNARILGLLSFTPQFVSMGLVRPGQRVPRSVKVIAHDPDFDLSKLKVDVRGDKGAPLKWAEYFETSIQPASGLSNAVDVQLRLIGLPEGSEGSFRGEMVILTGDVRNPELRVRFSGVCRAGVAAPKTPVKGGK